MVLSIVVLSLAVGVGTEDEVNTAGDETLEMMLEEELGDKLDDELTLAFVGDIA